MVTVCKEHIKRIPRGHTYNIVEKKDCKLCGLTEREIREYIDFRNKYLW